MRTGDVVIVYDKFSKCVFWRLGIVTELLTGSDGITRAAIVKIENSEHTRFLRRSIKHLIPIELSVNIEEVNSGEQSQEIVSLETNDQSSSSNSVTTNRRTAAVMGER